MKRISFFILSASLLFITACSNDENFSPIAPETETFSKLTSEDDVIYQTSDFVRLDIVDSKSIISRDRSSLEIRISNVTPQMTDAFAEISNGNSSRLIYLGSAEKGVFNLQLNDDALVDYKVRVFVYESSAENVTYMNQFNFTAFKSFNSLKVEKFAETDEAIRIISNNNIRLTADNFALVEGKIITKLIYLGSVNSNEFSIPLNEEVGLLDINLYGTYKADVELAF